ncbi:HNH endonuclease [Priestia megaterium]|uniref:HNH endonuclease n=1 Tax=Priestia megaterium TaxID=1404 RepID=UPI001DE4842F|nr:HNH endonuclease signature motif containing protein [Priestia megaterium]CAH0311579.1 hypothetical protein SRABI82_04961 [Priestia megaterium]
MAVKDELLALTSGMGLAGMAVSNFWDYGAEALDVFKDEIIECIVKTNKLTAVHWYLHFYQDIEEEVSKLWGSMEPEWIYHYAVRTLKEVNLNPDLPEVDFDSCKEENCPHYDCEVGEKIHEWTNYIRENHRKIDDLIVHSAFQFIFQDRNFLHDFHLELSKLIEGNMDYIKEKYPDVVTNKNRIKRGYFPKWMINAIFYRDKGTCSNAECRCDLSNLIRTQNTIHIDHIIPLDLYGSNDASNFQLLCETCNTTKGARSTLTSSVSVPCWNL